MIFPSTHWSLLAVASLNGDTAGRQALEQLCQRYWGPINHFIRLRGYREPEAQDLTQDFIVHLLEHSTLTKADRLRGKFRSFLLGALTRFLADERDRRNTLKRGQGAAHVELDHADQELAVPPQPETISFDHEWAVAILERALKTVQAECEANGTARFAVMRHFLPGSLHTPTYEAAAAQLQTSVPALKSELHRLRQRFKALVRQEVANTVATPHEIEEEMEYLQRVLMEKGSGT